MGVGIQSLFGRVPFGKHCVKVLCSPENEDGEAALDLSATSVKTWPEPVKREHTQVLTSAGLPGTAGLYPLKE